MDVMQRRRELMMLGGGLPGAYRRVEYLESSGTQYIDTGIPLSSGCVITLTFQIKSIAVGDNYAPYGWRYYGNYGGKQQFYINARAENTVVYRYVVVGVPAYTSSTGSAEWFDVGNKNTMMFDSYADKVYVNDVEMGSPYRYDFGNGAAFSSEGSSVYHPYLFALNNKGVITGISKNTKIYSYSVKQNNAFVQNFIPCVSKSDNKPGMYDTVSKIFYTNAGTGEFIVPEQ